MRKNNHLFFINQHLKQLFYFFLIQNNNKMIYIYIKNRLTIKICVIRYTIVSLHRINQKHNRISIVFMDMFVKLVYKLEEKRDQQ